MTYRQNKRSGGFTLVEMILSVALVGIAVGIGASLLQTFQANADLDASQSTYVGMIRRAQTLAMTQSYDSPWGVHAENGFIALFQGSSWETRDPEHDEVHQLSESISVSGLSDVTFEKLTGLPTGFGTTTLVSYESENFVYVNEVGLVSFGAVLPLGALPPEMEVLFGAVPIESGGTQNVGSQLEGLPVQLSYVIENTGSGELRLSGSPMVDILSPANVTSVSVEYPTTPIPSEGDASFSITYEPLAEGPYSFVVSIPNNDPDESPYTWTVSGTALPQPSEMGIASGVTSIADGGNHAVGQKGRNVDQTVTYEITNTGLGSLNLTGTPRVTVNAGTRVSSVSVNAQPPATIASGENVSFTITYQVTGSGNFNFTVSIPNNDSNENPYHWTVSGTVVAPNPEMAIVSNVNISDGGNHSVGTQARNILRMITYRIDNTGVSDLNLTGTPRVTVNAGTRVSIVSVNVQPPAVVAPGENALFTITYQVTGSGNFNFTVSIPNNDSNENPYNWTVRGRAAASGGGNIGP
jgi:prepilin-type N-terminal cleavage/methylation domain-containing protein